MSRLLFALILLIASPVLAVQAVNTAFCDDDGVTTTPAWATRPGGGATCLEVDPGNGDANVKFQYEYFSITDGTPGCNAAGTDIIVKQADANPATDHHATIIYDTVIDNYQSASCANEDVLFIAGGKSYNNQWIFIKDSYIINGWKCAGGTWDGPGSLGCSGPKSKSHSDGIQLRGTPVESGWFVMQDSVFVNGHNLQFLGQDQPQDCDPSVDGCDGQTFDLKPLGGWSFQGTEIGRRQSVGLATTWIDDCIDRTTTAENPQGSVDVCYNGNAVTDNGPREIWLIDVYGSTLFNVKGATSDGATAPGKVIVVNTGCSTTGCGQGAIGYDSRGWPHPLTRIGAGGSTCPNDQMTLSEFPTYCYTSLEAAAADGHTLPPFAQLSCAGWATPPAGCSSEGGSSAPVTTLTLSAGTIEVNNTVTMTAVPSSGTGPYTITWDYDGDGACDDGTPDSTSPYTQVTGSFVTAASYTLKACVADSLAATGTRTATLNVTPDCGNATAESPELCDGADLNGATCVTVVGTGSTGTPTCDATCDGFGVGTCTASSDTCGNGVCSPEEEAAGPAGVGACFDDCAEYQCHMIGFTAESSGWDYIASNMTGGERIDLHEVQNNQLNMYCVASTAWETGTGAVSGFTWDWTGPGGDGTTTYDNRQGGEPFMWCGDTGPGTIESALACGPPDFPAALSKGAHSLVITPCDVNPTGTIPGGPFTCPGNAGPTLTVAFDIVYPQVVEECPTCPECPVCPPNTADLNNDTFVNRADFELFVTAYMRGTP